MNKIKVMINGIPGNVAIIMAKHAIYDDRFYLIPYSLTGPEITETEHIVGSSTVKLISPSDRDLMINEIKEREGEFISIDYTHPTAVNDNSDFYCRNSLPFVMGTTGGDRELLHNTVISSNIPAVIAPNMAKQIVGFQAMMEYAADTFPGLFKGYTLEINESHQKGKADTSGTAKAMVQYFNKMGLSYEEKQIKKERDPEIQKTKWGVPDEHLGGHAWHTYTITSADNNAKFAFTHNINGRDIYSRGTLDAVIFLEKKIKESEKGAVFSMIDVMKG
ncbi:MAG: dihydrodipicolinate reductase [Desulfobacterales bacterium]|nr:dihydrodipicolinate reductase [Desulfobacteraceae bacterium]MBT7697511.1 dihydrodipicolinate reductase [Desulfobacterales bacterium]